MADNEFVIDREKLEVRTSRVFKAPATRLWRAYTDPEQIPKWWGPAYLTTVVDKMDVRVGGVWRFVQTEPSGKEHAFNGVYKEIDEPRKLVNTFEYEPIPGHIVLETMTLEERDNQTTVTAVSAFTELADLEGMLAMDMKAGQLESQARLAVLVESA